MNSKKSPRRGPATDNVAKLTIKEDGTLLATAAALLPDHKPTKLKSMLKHNQLAVNGVPSRQFDLAVHAGDQLWVNFDRSFQVFSHPRIKLVYEDNDIIVVDKGYGVLSTAAGKPSDDTVYNIIKKYARGFSDKANVYVVHRLDRDTSGLMVVAKSKQVSQRFESDWKGLVNDRAYVAVAWGKMESAEGTIKSWLTDGQYCVLSSPTDNGGKLAVTHYKTVRTSRRYSLLELRLETGRRNQIRVHLREEKHPVVHDPMYGYKDDISPINRLALHAFRLGFTHPITGKKLKFETPYPKAFEKLMEL